MFAIWRPFGILISHSLNRRFVPLKYLYCVALDLPIYQNKQIFNSFHLFTSESEPNDKSPNLDHIDINNKNGRYIAVFTCNICNYRSAKSFSKQAYHHGIVYVKCESCNNLHLISDQLGWFGEKQNIEEILQRKGEDVSKMELGENVSESDLELIKPLQHNKYFKH
ncbi:DNL zinc finger family protein [Theileria parva strain Muguga]|uniref:DNL zinc finger family protein n=1 Tax=Theileria parva strain Muguga TaxID=333668 RepID=UPI001C61F9CF|nr:DNL zinc finger family protein [Theileria parva strain Muguga]EAN33696.2 DNL zinc finger family protein [Theileria parva strain Muguga]